MISIRRTAEPAILSGTPSPNAWNDDTVRAALHSMQFNKCCYCEAQLPDHGGNQQIEHFWPKAADKWPEKKNNWNNLLLACAECNGAKRAQFPLDAAGAPMLINPSSPNIDPEQHITFIVFPPRAADWPLIGIAHAKNGSVQGDTTIQVVQLSSITHVRRRRCLYRQLSEWLAELVDASESSDSRKVSLLKGKFEGMMDQRHEDISFVREFCRQADLTRY